MTGGSVLRQLAANLRRPAPAPATHDPDTAAALADQLAGAAQARLGRSLALRHVDGGSCNGCELEIAMLSGAVHALQRYGLDFVASPRHADVLLVTGPITRNMEDAVLRTWTATPDPKFVVAVGDCAVDGGVFRGSYAVAGGVDAVLPVDLIIRGCPPSPAQLLAGLLSLLQANTAVK